MLRTSWIAGPDSGRPGPALVSVTDLRLSALADLPGVYRAARRLAEDWPALDGAHGMWLWARPTARRCGAVAIWRDRTALAGFLGAPAHVAVMRRYRGRGTVASSTWEVPSAAPDEVWSRAAAGLRG
ncbi:hypothetical protein AB0C11_36420 [Streptomyces sp. NPDC039016]|uniref:hypothetical protein n=1 Tax=Streptomyces sp. NPDC039016 TaxID=3154330 RepID=UPI0033C2B993